MNERLRLTPPPQPCRSVTWMCEWSSRERLTDSPRGSLPPPSALNYRPITEEQGDSCSTHTVVHIQLNTTAGPIVLESLISLLQHHSHLFESVSRMRFFTAKSPKMFHLILEGKKEENLIHFIVDIHQAGLTNKWKYIPSPIYNQTCIIQTNYTRKGLKRNICISVMLIRVISQPFWQHLHE